MSDVIWYVFFVGIFVLLLVVILLIVLDWRKDRKAAVKANNEKQPVVIYISKDGTVKTDSDKVKIDQEVAKTVKEEPLKEESKPVTNTENVQDGTVIKFSKKQTYHEAYLELAKDRKGFVDKLNKFASELDGKIKVNESKYHVLAKYLSYRLYELKISKGSAKASFFSSSSEFKQFQRSIDDVAIKEKPTVIYLNNDKSFDAAIDLLKIAYDQAKEAKKIRKENN